MGSKKLYCNRLQIYLYLYFRLPVDGYSALPCVSLSVTKNSDWTVIHIVRI